MSRKITTVNNNLYKRVCENGCNGSPCISVIIPVFNLAHIVMYTYRAITRVFSYCNIDYELIFVDDGSTDNTYNILRYRLKDNDKIKILRLPFNRGKGFALLHGFKRSSGQVIVFFDGDLDIDPRVILLLYSTVKLGISDIAIISKWHPQSYINYTFIRLLLSKLFNKLASILLGLRLKDTQTGAKAFKREVLLELSPYLIVKRYAFDIELLTLAVQRNYRIMEIPSPWMIKLNSSFKLNEIWNMLLDILSITYRTRITKRFR
ncbi:MAG: glycosyltransferase family 2 protein [Desulfurococcales archaeon]|nr:glycosyltransferase family 2 protein [Desulfurococcales archaeon]